VTLNYNQFFVGYNKSTKCVMWLQLSYNLFWWL